MNDEKSKDQKQAARASLAYRDMDDVLGYLAALQELEAIDAAAGTSVHFYSREAILLGAIVVYARSFVWSRSEGNADAKIDPNELRLFDDRPDLAALHATIVDRRLKEVAHADWERHQSELQPMSKPNRVARRNIRPVYNRGIDTGAFIELADHALQALYQRTYDLDVGIIKGEAAR